MTRQFTGDHLVLATHNSGKVEELRALLNPFGVRLSSNIDFGLDEPIEDGLTFADNARIKAQAATRATGLPALADDSGIEIDVLDNAPGIYTADWAEGTNGRDFNKAMQRAYHEIIATKQSAPWLARFCCTLVLAWPDGHDEVFAGVMPGQFVWPGRGEQGHGYDPVFQPDGFDITFGEMDRWQKNEISHRGDAINKLIEGCFASRERT